MSGCSRRRDKRRTSNSSVSDEKMEIASNAGERSRAVTIVDADV
jgi:hypothetical protein